MIKLFGLPSSTCTRKVLCTMHEIGIEHELEVVDLGAGAHKAEANLKRQPFGKIPAIQDGDVEMFESRAIARYLADKYGQGKLIPTDAVARARMNQFIDVESFYFTPHAMTFIYQDVLKRTQTEAQLQTAREGLGRALDVMDAHLAGKTFMAGTEFSLADVVYMPYLQYLTLSTAFTMVTERANVAAWWQRIAERPSWKKATGN